MECILCCIPSRIASLPPSFSSCARPRDCLSAVGPFPAAFIDLVSLSVTHSPACATVKEPETVYIAVCHHKVGFFAPVAWWAGFIGSRLPLFSFLTSGRHGGAVHWLLLDLAVSRRSSRRAEVCHVCEVSPRQSNDAFRVASNSRQPVSGLTGTAFSSPPSHCAHHGPRFV
jgi:hypothetical protein